MSTRWGENWGRGITYSPRERCSRPWRVKFTRKGKTIRIGDYPNLREAQRAAEAFLNQPPPAITTEGQSNGTL